LLQIWANSRFDAFKSAAASERPGIGREINRLDSVSLGLALGAGTLMVTSLLYWWLSEED